MYYQEEPEKKNIKTTANSDSMYTVVVYGTL